MGLLSLNLKDVTRTPAFVAPEGTYQLTCSNARYVLHDKEMPLSPENAKGLSLSCSFKYQENHCETFTYLNLFHPSPVTRDIAVQEFAEIVQAFGIKLNKNGEPVNDKGEELEPMDMKGLTCKAHIIVTKHYQTGEPVNSVKAWLPIADVTESKAGVTVAKMVDEYIDDIPF